jgi:hypothetical protein
MVFKRVIENFNCENCGEHVIGSGYTNHCPKCLWSKHVDNHPGDRNASCHGLLRPVGALYKNDEFIISYVCVTCGKQSKNKSASGDNSELLIKLSAQPS